MGLSRAERRRKDRAKDKDPIMTYRQSEWKKILYNESKKIEDKYYHIAIKWMVIASINALVEEFKFGEKRLTRFVDGLIKIYSSINNDDVAFKQYEQKVRDLGIDIKYRGNEGVTHD